MVKSVIRLVNGVDHKGEYSDYFSDGQHREETQKDTHAKLKFLTHSNLVDAGTHLIFC